MSNNLLQIIGSIILACVPAILWGHVFYHRNPETRRLTALTFFMGAIAVFPILIYKILWQYFPWMNAFRLADNYKDDIIGFSSTLVLPLSVIITFMIVGIIEENMKFLAVKLVDNNAIKSIDDSIEFFVLAALGFAFTENILYFYNIWMAQGADNLFLPFLFRSSFSNFAHLLFSGTLGYYYGIAHFATPILQEELKANRSRWVVKMHRVFSFGQEKMFHQEKLFEGLMIAIGLHALFDIFLEMKLTFMIVPFLVFGYMSLDYLFDKKENHKNYEKLLINMRNHPIPEVAVE